jgi:methionyl-tRNA formyltransferase
VTPPRVLFAGTPAFARASLAALLAAGIRPLAVLTQPDRPAGRGRKLTPSPVKALATEAGIDVLQPRTLRDETVENSLAAFAADVLVVAAYGLILPQAVLDIPHRGCLNVHASLLPRWRGAAPIQAAIREGDAVTGISLMQMEAGLDTGPVYRTALLDIGERETAGELHDRLAALGGELLADSLEDILAGRLTPEPQDGEAATYAGKISREDARIDWRQSGTTVDRCVRAYNPVPGAWTDFAGETVKIWQVRPAADLAGEPGVVLGHSAAGIEVACGTGGVVIESLQRPGKRPVTGAEFAAQTALRDNAFGSP